MTFEPDSKEEILDALIQGAEAAFGQEFEPDQATIVEEHYDAVADYLAEQQQEIRDVLDSASLETATDTELDARGALVGVPRKKERGSETTLEFSSDPAPETTREIPEGTVATTNDVDPISFETTQDADLEFIDGFEDGDISEYSGDTGAFTTSQSQAWEGNRSLLMADNGTTGVIEKDTPSGYTIEDEQTIELYMYPVGSTTAAFRFAVQNSNNYYRVIFDPSNAEVKLQTVSSSTVDDEAVASGNIANVKWHRIKIWWDGDNELSVEVTNTNTGNVTHTAELTSLSNNYTDGTIAFEDLDGSTDCYVDSVAISSTRVPAESIDTGKVTNVSSGTVTVFDSTLLGVDSVLNINAATGGRDAELDDIYRQRISTELSEGSRASLPALISAIKQVDDVRTVTVKENDTSSTDGQGRPPHSFEAIVDVDTEQEDDVAQTILDTKAAGDIDVGGYQGTATSASATLPNEETRTVNFSVPTQIQIYYDVDLTKTDEYEGDDAVRDSIVRYTGGTSSNSTSISGEIAAGEDVVFYQVAEAIMDVDGVVDITNLEIDTTSSPTGTSNISIGDGETAYTDGTDDSATDISSSDA